MTLVAPESFTFHNRLPGFQTQPNRFSSPHICLDLSQPVKSRDPHISDSNIRTISSNGTCRHITGYHYIGKAFY